MVAVSSDLDDDDAIVVGGTQGKTEGSRVKSVRTRLFDIGRHGSRDYLVMDFQAGETLAARLARGRLPLDEALSYASQIADALAAAIAPVSFTVTSSRATSCLRLAA